MQVLICDDDLDFAHRCETRLTALAAKNGVRLEFMFAQSGAQLNLFAATKFASADVILLDYHMPGENGIQTAHELRKQNIAAEIIFCTVDESHAIEGYDVDALHYIVKGKTDDVKVEELFLKAVSKIARKKTEMLSLSCAGERRNVPVDAILYFEVQNRIVTVHYREGKKNEAFEFYSTLSKIEELLYGKGFIRIHKAFLVNEHYIRRETTQAVLMEDGASLPVGRSYQKRS